MIEDALDQLIGCLLFFTEIQDESCDLEDLSLEDFKAESDLFEEDIIEALDARSIADARITEGGTGREAIRKQLVLVEDSLAADCSSL